MFNQFEPTARVAIKFLHLLKVSVNDQIVNDSLQNHPDWPSLTCIADTFTKLNIPNAAGSLSACDIDELPTPFLTYIDGVDACLAVVLHVSETEVSLYKGSSQKTVIEDKNNFIKKWNGIYLIAEPSINSGEVNYSQNKKDIFFKKLVPSTAFVLIGALCLLLANKTIFNSSPINNSFILGIYTQYLILITGIAVTTLLVWYEIDQNNPLLKKVCSGIVKSDCNAILTSKHSKLFSWLSWSEVGLFFFTGSLFTLLFGGNSISKAVSIVAWLNIIALPYTIFSVYYQARVAKQWCILCLSVQVLLLAGSINALTHGYLNNINVLDSITIANIFLLYLLPMLSWFSIKPYILRLQKNKDINRQFLRLKFDATVFNSLLRKQRAIHVPLEDIGIELGNPNASNTIVKVCNLYCNPCSKAHPEIEKLLDLNNDLKVKIIFTSRDHDSDPAIKPTSHLLAIAEHMNPTQLKNALNDWHLPVKKDYDLFAEQYPMNQELLKQSRNMTAMNDWCKATGITYTPTIFINGFELPNTYSIEDMQYFLLDSTSIGGEA